MREFVRLFAFAAAITASNPAAAQEQGWKLDPDARIELGLISAESATRDEQFVLNGDAFTIRAQAGLDYEDHNSRFRLEADRIEIIRLDEDRSDANRDRITALFEQDLDENWQVQARARYYDDLITAESANTDEIQGSLRVRYAKDRKHRVQVRASWREREYDNGAAAQTNGSGARVDAQYRRRFGRYHYATFDLRAEEINSDDARRGFERQSAKASYTRPITPDLRIRPALEIIKTKFDGRLDPSGNQRSDTLIAPELEAHYWPGPWRVEAEAKYIFTNSNLATREREGYRLTLSVGYVF